MPDLVMPLRMSVFSFAQLLIGVDWKFLQRPEVTLRVGIPGTECRGD